MSSKVVAVLSSILVLVCLVAIPAKAAEDDAAPKYKTKDVMKKAMKGPLLKKVASGDASDEEKKELHAMMVALSKNKPKKGDEESWKKLTGALVKASQTAVAGDAKAGGMLKKAANCKACHTSHK